MFLLTSVPAIRAIETGMKMREPMRLRKPMMRVPVFREMQAQQFASFGRETILGRKISENEPGQSWQPRLWVEILIWFEWKSYRLWRGSVLPVTNVSIYLYIEETLKCWSLEETLWTVHPGVSLLNYNTSCSDVKRNQAAREIRRAPTRWAPVGRRGRAATNHRSGREPIPINRNPSSLTSSQAYVRLALREMFLVIFFKRSSFTYIWGKPMSGWRKHSMEENQSIWWIWNEPTWAPVVSHNKNGVQ